MQIPLPHLRPTKSEALVMAPSNLFQQALHVILTQLKSTSCCKSYFPQFLMTKPGMELSRKLKVIPDHYLDNLREPPLFILHLKWPLGEARLL